jgi:hypothetical protein
MPVKISQKINLWVAILTIIQVIFLAVSIIINFGHFALPHNIFYFLSILMEFIYLLLLIYMIQVLIFFKEKTFIVIAFIIYMCLDILRSIHPVSMGRGFDFTFGLTLGVLSFVPTIYLFIAALKIKTRYIVFPFRLFSYVLLILTLLKLMITIIFPLIVDVSAMKYNGLILLRSIMYCIDAISIFKLVAILLIVKAMNKFIGAQNTQNTEVGLE